MSHRKGIPLSFSIYCPGTTTRRRPMKALMRWSLTAFLYFCHMFYMSFACTTTKPKINPKRTLCDEHYLLFVPTETIPFLGSFYLKYSWNIFYLSCLNYKVFVLLGGSWIQLKLCPPPEDRGTTRKTRISTVLLMRCSKLPMCLDARWLFWCHPRADEETKWHKPERGREWEVFDSKIINYLLHTSSFRLR